MKKPTIIAIVIAIVLIGGAIWVGNLDTSGSSGVPANNVSVVNGTQIITLNARGGYQPRKSTAQAGIPTIVRFITNGTFDCSSSVRIPSMKISKFLPQTGTTDIELGTSTLGLLRGSCGMGMYPFEIQFN